MSGLAAFDCPRVPLDASTRDCVAVMQIYTNARMGEGEEKVVLCAKKLLAPFAGYTVCTHAKHSSMSPASLTRRGCFETWGPPFIKHA